MSISSMITKSGHTVSIEKPNVARDSSGARISGAGTWESVAIDQSAWVQDLGSNEINAYAARDLKVSKKVFVQTEYDICEGYRVRFGNDKYIVRGVKNAAGLNKLWALFVG